MQNGEFKRLKRSERSLRENLGSLLYCDPFGAMLFSVCLVLIFFLLFLYHDLATH